MKKKKKFPYPSRGVCVVTRSCTCVHPPALSAGPNRPFSMPGFLAGREPNSPGPDEKWLKFQAWICVSLRAVAICFVRRSCTCVHPPTLSVGPNRPFSMPGFLAGRDAKSPPPGKKWLKFQAWMCVPLSAVAICVVRRRECVCVCVCEREKKKRFLHLSPPGPLLSECGTNKIVKARFWPWLSVKSLFNLVSCSLLARMVSGVAIRLTSDVPAHVATQQPSSSDQIDHFRCPVSWLADRRIRLRQSRNGSNSRPGCARR